MPDPEKTAYHFEQAPSRDELKGISEARYREGWRKASEPRELEIRFPSDRTTVMYSQTYTRTEAGPDRMLRCLGTSAGDRSRVFWGEIAPCDHWLQVYPDEEAFFTALEAYVTAGLTAGEAVVLIVTPGHRAGLEQRLAARGIDLLALRADDQYIVLDAEETLSRFMVNGWPDEALFRETVRGLLTRARGRRDQPRRVRAFGEMVAILWARKECGATVRLEHLWHVLCQLEDFALFCAYPRSGFTQGRKQSLQDICAAHSRIID